MRGLKFFQSYYVLLGNCFDVKLTTKGYGSEINWSLESCSNGQMFSDDMEYIEVCCLNPGVYTLKCGNSYGDGWNGGWIEIQGIKYCEDFYDGPEKYIQVTIVTSGKYSFSQT